LASEQIDFSFSWLALKLLGKGLYSNPWNALSELVANGFDAGANTVWVDLDLSSKASSRVDVIDNGSGMSRDGLNTYAQVGYNKRADFTTEDGASTVMGRKGIGKLAALYLSQHFYLVTTGSSGTTSWELDARQGRIQDDENPRLVGVEGATLDLDSAIWDRLASGTYVSMRDVDLSGHGARAIEALSARLANQFLLDGGDRRILVRNRTGETRNSSEYKPAKRNIAYRNLVFIERRSSEVHPLPAELEESKRAVQIPARGLAAGHVFELPKVTALTRLGEIDDSLASRVDLQNSTYDDIPFSLSGWIGVHSTIDTVEAQKNDSRFQRSKFYNPAQIRLYVRGKLANEHLLGQLGLTSTYLNYIEGEISFDILDNDLLPDIATANRQDFDETDDRIALLRALVRPVVQSLIRKRTELADSIRTAEKDERETREAAGKTAFSEQFAKDLENFPGLDPDARREVQSLALAKIQGDVVPKTKFKLFISHASADRCFGDFIYNVLKERGAFEHEIFYTSKHGEIDQYGNLNTLARTVRENIISDNTLMLYLTSENFLRSQYCMFEGGAGWATRAVGEYLKVNLEFKSIPAFLTEGQSELPLIQGGVIDLRLDTYRYLVRNIFNVAIAHINSGRIDSDGYLDLFEEITVPAPHVLDQRGELESDYFDEVIQSQWRFYVEKEMGNYYAAYPPHSDGSHAFGLKV
jgi:hypothetical protein